MRSKQKVIHMDTTLGLAEAIKPSQGEPWVINYPWGGERFHGSAQEVRARMSRAIRRYEREEIG